MATPSPDDHFAIERLYARYNHAIQMADGAVWAACFSEDGRFSNRGGSRQGAAELAAYANASSPADNARYWINNLVLEGTEEEPQAPATSMPSRSPSSSARCE